MDDLHELICPKCGGIVIAEQIECSIPCMFCAAELREGAAWFGDRLINLIGYLEEE